MQRQEDEEEAQAKISTNSIGRIQAKGTPSLSDDANQRIQQMRGQGQVLPKDVRNEMEGKIGADFSSVRVHANGSSSNINKQINARAFTVGSDVFFGSGEFSPGSKPGKKLLAHELTHVVQQGGAARKKDIAISRAQPSIQRLSIKGIINKVLSFIPGFTLVTVFLGENPVTGDPVPQTGKMLMKGATELIPIIGPILWGELEKSGSTEKAGKWLDKRMQKLGLTIPLIKRLISEAWDAISIWKGIDGNIAVVKKIFGPYLGRLLGLIRSIKDKIREFVIEGFLRMAGPMGVQVWNVLRKSPKALKKILDDPVILIKNFFSGVKMGFDNFGKNFVKHFKNAVMEWIFGALGEGGLQLPSKFNLAGIFSIVMQVLGLTYNQIRARVVAGLAKIVGREKAEKAISMIETGVDFVKRILTEGPIALWDMLKEKIGNFKQMVLGAIVSWAKKTIITKAIMKLVSMLNPAGAIFQAIMMVYDVVVFFINNWSRIKAIVTGIFNSLAVAALGQIGKIGKFIEGILAKGMTVLIAFLARLIGLGGIAKKVQEIIAKIRKPITKAIDKVVGVIINLAKPIINAIARGSKKLTAAVDKAKQKGKAAVSAVKEKGKAVVGKVVSFVFPKHRFKAGGESHTISVKKKGSKKALIISSTPTPMETFLVGYEAKHSATLSQQKKTDIATAKGFIKSDIDPLLAKLSKLKETEKNKKAITEINQQILKKEVTLSEMVKKILGSTKKLKGTVEKYKLEGLTGTYGSMPKPPYDDLTADHQPQAAILVAASNLPYFKKGSKGASMRARGENRAKAGFAINLQSGRHAAGRTYGGKGSSTKNKFLTNVKTETKNVSTDQEKRNIVVGLIKKELALDVEAMRNVVDKEKNWKDLKRLRLPDTEKEKLKKDTRSQILSGESRVAAQDLDSLKG